MTNKLWIEKYRPHSFEEYILDEDEKLKFIKDCIDNNAFKLPNMILFSKSPGTGKTTLAKIIVEKLGADFLYLNASDERGIDVMRQKVKSFAYALAFNDSVPKIIHLDEADSLTKDAQDMLRNLIEESSETCRFVFTCNNINKIIEPIRSRCKTIELSSPSIPKIRERINYICDKENLTIDEVSKTELIVEFYPDIRSMIVALESGDSFVNQNKDITAKLYNAIITNKKEEAIKLCYDRTLNQRQIISNLTDMYVNKKDFKFIDLFAEFDFRIAMSATPEIQLIAMVNKMFDVK